MKQEAYNLGFIFDSEMSGAAVQSFFIQLRLFIQDQVCLSFVDSYFYRHHMN